MVRAASLLHPRRQPAEPRAAASLLFVRDAAAGGIEILMTRRSLQADFAPGAWGFPSSPVEPADASPLANRLAARRQAQPDEQVRFAITAIREAWTAVGILLARPAITGRGTDSDSGTDSGTDSGSSSSSGADSGPAGLAALQRDADASTFLARAEAAGLRLAVDAVWPLCRWISGRDLAQRFDTCFLVASMPPGQQATAGDDAQPAPEWVAPADALARFEAGRFEMLFPTIRTLRRLAHHRDTAGLIAECAGDRDQPLWTSCPRAGLVNGRIERYTENEAPFGELELTSPDGQLVHSLDWRRMEAVALLRHVTRLTAPNPGVMTGPGTNTYVIGTAAHGFIVIDPGPALDEHIDRIHRFVGADLRQILCTHSHADHSPGAARLQELTGAPIAGLSSRPTANAQSFFRPDTEIDDDEAFVLRAGGDPALATITLRSVLTPGHAANHVCFFLEEDRLLFSGDHILNGSTTIINPPDGNMVAYLESLQRLAALEAAFILPAHGHVIGFPARAIDRLIKHRLAREAKVLAAIDARPGAGLATLVTLAYDDTPAAAHGIAQRSLLAHAEKLVADGRIEPTGDGWRQLG